MKKLRFISFLYASYRKLKRFRNLSAIEQEKSGYPAEFVEGLIARGPVFIKLGQILSTRPDVLPPHYIMELAQLQEKVPPFPFTQVREIIEKELATPVEKAFDSMRETPVASASLSQVHFAQLSSGEEVAVKVQRPGIKASMLEDMKMIEGILNLLSVFFPRIVKRTNLQEGFREFRRYTLQELDFAHEGATIERFRQNFDGWEDIIFPKIYWPCTTEKILTMDRLNGMRLHVAASTLPVEQRKQLNRRIAEMELKMFISDGLFHADLHPGNIFFREDGKIILLDFGMYGELSKAERDHFVLYWLAVVQNDVKRAFYHFKKQCKELPRANEDAFYAVFKKLATQFYHSRLIDTSITKVYLEMINAGHKYGFLFPSNLLLHAKALTTAEALTFKLDPEARFEEITKPLIAKEFAKIALREKHFQHRVEQILPELMLSGYIPPVQDGDADEQPAYDTHPFWIALYDQLLNNLRNWQKDAGIFKSILNKPAEKILRENGWNDRDIQQLLSETWNEYLSIEPNLRKQQTLGATFTLHLGAATIALFRALQHMDTSKDTATQLIYDIGWDIYSRMSEWPMLIAGLLADDPYKKMEIATQVFRVFPFTAPDYGWEEVPADEHTVAFNCTRCQVAALFKSQDLGDLCYHTWCKLDFPLAEMWGGRLERSGSIAGGAKVCDFKWKVDAKP